MDGLLTVVELPHFVRKAGSLLSAEERKAAVDYLAAHPESGAVMQGTGGLRKLRWGTGSRGKSGGVRLIYYYYNAAMPLFMITVFAKSEKANLTKAERNELAKLAMVLRDTYKQKRGQP